MGPNRNLPLCIFHGPLTKYVKFRVAHAPGMPRGFSLPPRVSDTGMHHGTCVTHVLWCMPGSLTSGLLWSRWRGKRSWYSRRMHNPQFYVSGKRPMVQVQFGTSLWVISHLQNHPLHGRLGVVIFDSCFDGVYSYHRIAELHSGQITLITLDGQIINPDSIVVYVGGHYRYRRGTFDDASLEYTARCRYNAVKFLQNPHNRNPIACPWRWGMGCLLWFFLLIHFLPLILQCRI